MGVEGVDVGEQGAHHGRDAGTHVLGGQTGKVPDRKTDRQEALEHWFQTQWLKLFWFQHLKIRKA